MPLVLTDADVRRVLPVEAVVTAMEQALVQYSRGAVDQPVRSTLAFGPRQSYLGVMPAATREPAAVGAKLVSIVHENVADGLPSHLATVVLLDPHTGALHAIIDGRHITAIRTAAVSAVSAKHLARPEASLLAILGSGVQARAHLEALAHVRPLREVQVWSPTPEHRRRFAAEMAPRVGLAVRAVDGPDVAVRDADIVALATAATEPVLRSVWVRDGTHVVAVGAYRPTAREMDSDLVARGRLFVDSRAGALAEAGDLLIPMREGRFSADHIVGELGEVIDHRIPGRRSRREVTVFKSLGMAVEDIATADLACRLAEQAGVGTSIET
jgi:ornithine cyclodeaminase